MKSKYTVLMVALGLSVTAVAQETDDMYFNAKDRLAQTESNQVSMAGRYVQQDAEAVASNPVNPPDSYTGRGVNPEFSAQQKNGATLVQENPDYFLTSYKPKDINSNLYSANSNTYTGCGCGYRSPYSPYGYYGNRNMYSPYGYGSMYSPYGGYYSPYGGMSTMIGYSFGSYGSMYSMGMGYGMGSMMYGGMYGSPYGYYNPYGYSSYYGHSPGMADDRPLVVNGRRPIRNNSMTNPASYTGTVAGTNGRTRETGQARTNYYDQSWRKDPNNFPSRSYDYNGRSVTSGRTTTTGRSWAGDTNRSRSYNSMGSSPRSMGSFGSGASGGSRSSGGGGHSRGRN